MSVTDLLSRIPFSPVRGREPEARPAAPSPRRAGAGRLPRPEGPARSVAPTFVAKRREAPAPAPAALLPSWAVMLIGGLLLGGITVSATLAAVAVDQAAPVAAPPAAAAAPVTPAEDRTFSADPTPIPVDMLTALEAVGQEAIEVELSQLLAAIGHGFGARSARLEPTLQSYAYRMGSRFEWSADTFHVAVTAPDASLAVARGDLLERLFPAAVASGQLRIGTGPGPHALSLVSPTTE